MIGLFFILAYGIFAALLGLWLGYQIGSDETDRWS